MLFVVICKRPFPLLHIRAQALHCMLLAVFCKRPSKLTSFIISLKTKPVDLVLHSFYPKG